MNTTFKHSGDRGDLLAFLPVMRYFGGGILYIEAATYTRERLTRDKWCGLDLLLKQQPYVADVLEWQGQRVSINGCDFRAHMGRALRSRDPNNPARQKSLVDWQLDTHQVPLSEKDKPWIAVEPKKVAPVVINRTGAGRASHHCYHNPMFPWHRVWQKYKDKAVFVGLPEEHDLFCAVNGHIPHYPTKDLLEAAQVIAGAELFIGNQSACCWIAQAMHKPLVQEVWLQGPNSILTRPGAHYGFDQNVHLPDV